MENIINGLAYKMGDDINTDLIIAARYLNVSDSNILAKHIFEDMPIDFFKGFNRGDIIVAGDNFGCGSSREHAPVALKAAGVSAVIAKSFARIFYRNSFNTAFLAIESDDVDKIEQKDSISVDILGGKISILNKNLIFNFKPIEPFLYEILASGGLMGYTKNKIKNSNL